MAYAQSNVVPAPMAAPGYGKRSVSGQPPRRAGDFEQLPAREAAIAAYIDRLPEGAAMDVKTLARDIAAYGQQAVRTALNRLSEAGHLRRVREPLGEDRTQWVFRTYFSRSARGDDWWLTFLTGDVVPDREEAAPTPVRQQASAAYDVLAGTARVEPRITLSARECAELEPLAADWLARGASAPDIVRALTQGLPPQVHSPAAFARRRLTDKLPPARRSPAPTDTPRRHTLLECTDCGVPGRPTALPGGLCRACRAEPSAPREAALRPGSADHIRRLRTAIRLRERITT